MAWLKKEQSKVHCQHPWSVGIFKGWFKIITLDEAYQMFDKFNKEFSRHVKNIENKSTFENFCDGLKTAGYYVA